MPYEEWLPGLIVTPQEAVQVRAVEGIIKHDLTCTHGRNSDLERPLHLVAPGIEKIVREQNRTHYLGQLIGRRLLVDEYRSRGLHKGLGRIITHQASAELAGDVVGSSRVGGEGIEHVATVPEVGLVGRDVHPEYILLETVVPVVAVRE